MQFHINSKFQILQTTKSKCHPA